MPRNATQFRTNIDVVPEQGGIIQSVLPAVTKAASEIISASQEAKILDSTAKAKLEINGLTNKFRLENQSNPDANLDKFKAERDKILNNYSKDTSPLFRNQWLRQEHDIRTQTDASHQSWSLQQNANNAEFNLKQAMQSNYDLSFVDGQNFATGNEFDISAAMKYKQSYDQLAGGASKYLGEETTRQMMANYEKNYMKSLVIHRVDNMKKFIPLKTKHKKYLVYVIIKYMVMVLLFGANQKENI